MDDDLTGLTREQLISEVGRLRDGIRSHRDATGHELCWHHPALWALLPERTDPVPVVPDWPVFLRGCVRYRQSLDEQAPSAPRTHLPVAAQPVTAAVTVPLPPHDAFRLFAEEMHRWWPREYTWSADSLEWIGIEPHEGGRCTERGPHGFQCDWGRVLAWAPAERLELAWQIAPSRAPEPDPSRASHVVVQFSAENSGTRVAVEHRDFDRHGDDGAYRTAMASGHGWPFMLERFAGAADVR